MIRLLRRLFVLAFALGCGVLFWPQAVGLQTAPLIGQAVAWRPAAAVGALAAVVALWLIGRILRPVRRTAGALAFVLVVFAVANASLLAVRGLSGTPIQAQVGAMTVLEWNTQGELVPSSTIARLALESGADIVALPETTAEQGEAVAVQMKASGSPMWVHTVAFDQIYRARSTTLLISPDLGDYTVTSYTGSGPPLNTNTLPTVVAEPVSGEGPTIIAAHQALRRWPARWRTPVVLAWLSEQCQSENVILVGDFNSSVDNFAGLGRGEGDLGRCRDAGVAANGAGLGTWPTNLPSYLGAPIDHVLVTDNWQVTGFSVPSQFDGAGSDHRPLLVQLKLKE